MTQYIVPITLVCSVTVDTTCKPEWAVAQARDAARSFMEALEPDASYIGGWNSAREGDAQIVDVSGFDIEGIEAAEVELNEPTTPSVILMNAESTVGVMTPPTQVDSTQAITHELRTFTIDIWRDGDLLTWEGNAVDEENAHAAALAELNEAWCEEWTDWEEMACDVDGTDTIPWPAVMADRISLKAMSHYRLLADGLTDLLEKRGRATEIELCGDDYDWLVRHLEAIAIHDASGDAAADRDALIADRQREAD